jgi:hypothetical protein
VDIFTEIPEILPSSTASSNPSTFMNTTTSLSFLIFFFKKTENEKKPGKFKIQKEAFLK